MATTAWRQSPVRGHAGHHVTWRMVLIWYLAAAGLACVGTYLQYHGVLTSPVVLAWQVLTNVDDTTMDIVRIIIATLLALFALRNLEVVYDARDPLSLELSRTVLTVTERWLAGIALALAALFAFWALPSSFADSYQTLVAAGTKIAGTPIPTDDSVWRQVYIPYLPYALYVFGLWIGIVLPVLIAMLRRLAVDFPQIWILKRTLVVSKADATRIAASAGDIKEYAANYQVYLAALRDAATRYVPLLLVVATMCLAEELTNLHCSVGPWATNAGKVALWALLGPALIISLVVFAGFYDDGIRSAKFSLEKVLAAARSSADPDALPEAQNALVEAGKESSMAGIVAVAKTGQVGVYVLVVVATSWLSATKYGMRPFVPQNAVAWFTKHVNLLPPSRPTNDVDPTCPITQQN
jgi:hypothetical protein